MLSARDQWRWHDKCYDDFTSALGGAGGGGGGEYQK